MAQTRLIAFMTTQGFIKNHFPFKTVRVTNKVTREKGIGDMSENLARWQSYMTAKVYFATKKEGARILQENFDLVYWEGMGRFMKHRPRQYRNWLTKQTNGACGCHGHRAKWKKQQDKDPVIDACPNCGAPEPSTHATRCTDKQRKTLFEDSVEEVDKWMIENDTEPDLQHMVKSYLRARDTAKMINFLPELTPSTTHQEMNRYRNIALVQDCLGWDCILEGRIPAIFVQHKQEHL